MREGYKNKMPKKIILLIGIVIILLLSNVNARFDGVDCPSLVEEKIFRKQIMSYIQTKLIH